MNFGKKMKQKYRSEETYKHYLAKRILNNWLSQSFIVREEENFIFFKPDLSVYTEDGLNSFYEVEYKNGMTGRKLNIMMYWAYINDIHIPVYEVSSDWILNQCRKPKKIICIKYQL